MALAFVGLLLLAVAFFRLKGFVMSYASKFIFDPIKAAIARALTSSNPVAQSTAAAAHDAVSKLEVDTSADALSHNSAAGVVNNVIGDLETGLKGVVDSFVYAGVSNAIPLVGGLVAPEAVTVANMALDFAEQHAMSYVAALFAHHKAAVASSTAPAPAQ